MKVLVIDDDRSHLNSIRDALNLNGIETDTLQDPFLCLQYYREKNYDAVLTDIRMKGMDGIDVLKKITQFDPVAIVMVMTGFPYDGDEEELKSQGAYAFYRKPVDIEQLIDALTNVNNIDF